MCSLTMARSLCLAVSPIRIAKAKWKAASDTRRKLHSKDSASKVWKKRKTYLDQVGGALGRHSHSRHNEAPSGSHVRRRKTSAVAFAAGTVSLLPIRRENGSSGWLCRSRSRLLQRAARLDWPPGASAVGRQGCAAARSKERSAFARALAR